MLLKRKMFEKHWQDSIAVPAFDVVGRPFVISN